MSRTFSTHNPEGSHYTAMTDRLDDQYLEWLYDLVGRQAKNITHRDLFDQLFHTEFVPMPEVPSDENRSADGIALRNEFVRHDVAIRPSRAWMNEGCSVLEMMIGMARHISFEMDGEIGQWFWHLMDNVGLSRYNDHRWNKTRVDQIVERLVWRQYSYDGSGGIFPLKEPHEDQRYVELWFQMESYMLEMS